MARRGWPTPTQTRILAGFPHGIKQQVPNTLLMFRLGDFYEMMFEDAEVGARVLDEELAGRPLDFFVCFSSAGALLGFLDDLSNWWVRRIYRGLIFGTIGVMLVALVGSLALILAGSYASDFREQAAAMGAVGMR